VFEWRKLRSHSRVQVKECNESEEVEEPCIKSSHTKRKHTSGNNNKATRTTKTSDERINVELLEFKKARNAYNESEGFEEPCIIKSSHAKRKRTSGNHTKTNRRRRTSDERINEIFEYKRAQEPCSIKSDSSPTTRKLATNPTNRRRKTFDERVDELLEYKIRFGHVNVPYRFAENPPLGHWCGEMMRSYRQLQKGERPRACITKERIERLEEIGFRWNVKHTVFDALFDELVIFKDKFGHCNVQYQYPALGRWCSNLRYLYSNQQKMIKSRHTLSKERIERLEKIGFKWTGVSQSVFDGRCDELIEFKKKFNHCHVPTNYKANHSFCAWCNNMRRAYDQLQKGEKPHMNMSAERIERLEELGFNLKGFQQP